MQYCDSLLLFRVSHPRWVRPYILEYARVLYNEFIGGHHGVRSAIVVCVGTHMDTQNYRGGQGGSYWRQTGQKRLNHRRDPG